MRSELGVNFKHVLSMVESGWRVVVGSSILLSYLLNRQDLVRLLKVNINHFAISFLNLLPQIELIILVLTDLNRLLSMIRENGISPHRLSLGLRSLVDAIFASEGHTFTLGARLIFYVIPLRVVNLSLIDLRGLHRVGSHLHFFVSFLRLVKVLLSDPKVNT